LRKKKAARFVKESERKAYLASHLFLSEVLSPYFPQIPSSNWKFEYNAYGKPYLSKEHQVQLYFNLSHSVSHVYIICSKEYGGELNLKWYSYKDLNVRK